MCLTLPLASLTDRRFLGSRRNSARTRELHGPQPERSKPESFKWFQAGLFGNSLGGLHNGSKQSTNRNRRHLKLGSFKMEQQIAKKNRLQYWAWIFKITWWQLKLHTKEEPSSLQLRKPLKSTKKSLAHFFNYCTLENSAFPGCALFCRCN